MENQGKKKSESVLLCRSKKKSSGKEIQGLVFDHPSMPKIVTVSSGFDKQSPASRGNNPTGGKYLKQDKHAHLNVDKFPAENRYDTKQNHHTGDKYLTRESFPAGHHVRGQHRTRHSAHQQYAGSRFSPKTMVYHPSWVKNAIPSPPALIHRPRSGSTSNYLPERNNSEGLCEENSRKSQICFPAYYESKPTHSVKLMHARQHELNSARMPDKMLQPDSTSADQLEKVMQHSRVIGRQSKSLNSDDFSRDFHLSVWRDSHHQAVTREENAPYLPIRRLVQRKNFPPTSNLILDRDDNRYHSSSIGENGANVPIQSPGRSPVTLHMTGQQRKSTMFPLGIRENSTESVCSSFTDSSPDSSINPSEMLAEAGFSPTIQTEQNTSTRTYSVRRLNKTGDEYNSVKQIARSFNSQHVFNPDHLPKISDDNKNYLPAMEKTLVTNLAESSLDKVRKLNCPEHKLQRRWKQTKNCPALIIISDSEDEELPILHEEAHENDTLKVKPNLEVPKTKAVISPAQSESEGACVVTKVIRLGNTVAHKGGHSVCAGEKKIQETITHRRTRSEDRERLGANYCKNPEGMGIPGDFGTQNVVESAQLIENDGENKRTTGDRTHCFVAGSAELAQHTLEHAAKEIRRISCCELENTPSQLLQNSGIFNTGKSVQETPGCTQSGGNPKRTSPVSCATVKSNLVSKLLKFDHHHDIKVEEKKNCKMSAETHNKCFEGVVCTVPQSVTEASGLASCDVVRCCKCDCVLNDYPGTRALVNMQKTGPKPTGIVVGVKQISEMTSDNDSAGSNSKDRKPLYHEIVGSDNDLQKRLDYETVVSNDDLKKPVGYEIISSDEEQSKTLDYNAVGSVKRTKVPNTQDQNDNGISKDSMPNAVSNGCLDKRQFNFSMLKNDSGVNWNNAEKCMSGTKSENKQYLGKYSLKLEEEQTEQKNYCLTTKDNLNRKSRSSLQAVKRKLSTEDERDSCSDTPQSPNGLRKRVCADEHILTSSKFSNTTLSSNNTRTHSETIAASPGTTTSFPDNIIVSPESTTTLANTIPASPDTTMTFPDTIRISPNITAASALPDTTRTFSKQPQIQKIAQTEELSLLEWTEILEGRIAQVQESIQEEAAPWKTKNKKKVLEKLENHLAWLTGPNADANVFLTKKLQFFQTMKKQYELMGKIKAQRQSMHEPPAANVETSKRKSAVEVQISKRAKGDQKSVNCKVKTKRYSHQII